MKIITVKFHFFVMFIQNRPIKVKQYLLDILKAINEIFASE